MPVEPATSHIAPSPGPYNEKTGLFFVVPEQKYATRRVPCFQTLGNGYHGLDSLGAVFGIENYIWQQQADGAVFVGSWNDSRWASRPVEIAEKLFTRVDANGAKVLPAVPTLRPGVRLNEQYLTSLRLAGHEMVVQCGKSLRT
ncbi:MAG: hypothetical protein ACNI3A_02995 [Desulfovibrio sp.]|uniref:hypothetical protein n=1 Tax=Desulfovibrio sp. 7SRBS1 TaxID=3378064 RepID=UPI003B42771A